MSTQLVDYFVVIGASPSRKLHAYAPSATPQQNVSPSMNHHNFHRYHSGDHKKRESVVDECEQKSRGNSNNGHHSDKFDQMMEISNILSRFSFKASILGRYPLEDDPDSPLSSEIALFALPSGVTVSHDCSLPSFFTFVLTGGDGARVHGCSLVFFEAMEEPDHLQMVDEMIQEEIRTLRLIRRHSNPSHCLHCGQPKRDHQNNRNNKTGVGATTENSNDGVMTPFNHNITTSAAHNKKNKGNHGKSGHQRQQQKLLVQISRNRENQPHGFDPTVDHSNANTNNDRTDADLEGVEDEYDDEDIEYAGDEDYDEDDDGDGDEMMMNDDDDNDDDDNRQQQELLSKQLNNGDDACSMMSMSTTTTTSAITPTMTPATTPCMTPNVDQTLNNEDIEVQFDSGVGENNSHGRVASVATDTTIQVKNDDEKDGNDDTLPMITVSNDDNEEGDSSKQVVTRAVRINEEKKTSGTNNHNMTNTGHNFCTCEQSITTTTMATTSSDKWKNKRKPIYMSKSFCILSHYPLYSTFKLFLTELYRTSITPSVIPIERYICNFVSEVPLPPQGRIQVQYSIGDKTTMINRPPENDLPLCDVNFELLFKLFSIDNIILMLECLLSEKQILIHSYRYSLLGTVADALTSFMYPFQWHHVYIPLLPRSCLEFLSAPVPFIMGTHTSYLHDLEIPREVVRINIDTNQIFRSVDVPHLPDRQINKLKSMLAQYSIHDRRDDTTEDTTDLDVAFNMAPKPTDDDMDMNQSTNKDNNHATGSGSMMGRREPFPTVKVRLAFFRIFVSLFQKYKNYLKLDVKVDNILNFESSNHFKKQLFIRDQRESAKSFLSMFIETQAFQRLIIDKVMYDQSPIIRYFEESIIAKFNRSKFKLYKVPTPFLSDKTTQILDTVIAMAPDTSHLDPNEKFVYPTIPKLDASLFNDPRDYRHLVSMSDCCSRSGTAILQSWKTILSTLNSLSNQVISTEDQRFKYLRSQHRKSLKLKSAHGHLQSSRSHARTLSTELDSDLTSSLATSITFAGAPLYVDITTAVNHTHPLSVFSKFHFDTQEVCPDCHFELSDTDVKMGWSGNPQEYRTMCPNCLGRFVPRFSVLFDNNGTSNDERSDLSSVNTTATTNTHNVDGVITMAITVDSVNSGKPKRKRTHSRVNSTFMMMSSYASSLHKIRYEYLSPVVLKKEVENLLKKDVSADERLFSNHPLIFWNLILHFRELSIPLNILIPQVDWKSVLRTLAEMRLQMEQEEMLMNLELQ